jgi:hypothetical protein
MKRGKYIFRKFLLLFSNIEVKMFFVVHIIFLKSAILPMSKLEIEREVKKPFVQRTLPIVTVVVYIVGGR